MAAFYNTPHTTWSNQPKSYWVPLGIVAHILAYIRTIVVKAVIRVGNKWTTYNATSERVD